MKKAAHFPTLAKILFAALFVLGGLNHFLHPAVYLQIMPPYLPLHRELVWLSGICEIGLGSLLLIPRFARRAAWGLIALLVAVFPANLFMATRPELYPDVYPVMLWLRLPLQGVFIAWAWRYARARAPRRQAESLRLDTAESWADRPAG